MRAYRRMTGLHFDTLTGTPAQIARMSRFFGVYYKRVPQDNRPTSTGSLTVRSSLTSSTATPC